MPLKVHTFLDPESLARFAAMRFGAPSKREFYSFSVALSGGRIAKTFYDAIVAEVTSLGENLDCVDFFFADERCVPPTDPESNFLTARQALFDPLQIRAEKIHRIHGEVEADYASQEAEAELCRIASLNSEGQPSLDLAILGMGEDGHTASLFPGESESLINSKQVYRSVTASKPPPRRITLGYAPLRAATQIWVLASGAGKAAALRQVLDELERNAPQLPLARVLHRHPNVLILTDIPGAAAIAKNL